MANPYGCVILQHPKHLLFPFLSTAYLKVVTRLKSAMITVVTYKVHFSYSYGKGETDLWSLSFFFSTSSYSILKTHHYEKCRLTENHLYEYADCTSTYRYTGKICQKAESIPIRPLRISNFLRKDLMLEILYSCYSQTYYYGEKDFCALMGGECCNNCQRFQNQ